MNYTETLEYLYNRLAVFHQIGGDAYKPGLDNTINLMKGLNDPHLNFKSIHIAGTNGKGSVSHMLAAILQSAGYKVGLYTSPHLVDFGERIRVNGQMIEQQYVIDFVANHQDLFSQIEPSFFEATMAMAFNYFADCKVDIAIIEVGLGGRLDSTNIIRPELSVITNISFDHIGFLGNSLSKIAFEKAGIIKLHTPVVIGEFLTETRPEFDKKASEMQAPIIYAEENFTVTFLKYFENKMIVESSDNEQFIVGLCGNYQLKNIATVLTAVQQINQLGLNITENALKEGLKYTTELTGLQGRWQIVQTNPTVIADTAHNVAGISYVTEQLKTQTYDKLHIVIGMVNDKDISSVLNLLPQNAIYYFTQAQISRALSAADLQEKAKSFDLKGECYISVEQAVECAIKNADKNDLVFIGGSNFVIGEALPLAVFNSY